MNNNNILPNADSPILPVPFEKQNTTNAFSLKISELYFREDNNNNPTKKYIAPLINHPQDKASKFKKTGYIYKKYTTHNKILTSNSLHNNIPNVNDIIRVDSIRKSKFTPKHKVHSNHLYIYITHAHV